MPRSSSSRSSADITRDHDEIMRWVEERGGSPATVKGTARSGAGVLRIDFPGQGEDAKMEHLTWDEFFEKFDEENLAFLHQDVTADGEVSRFSKFVDADEAARGSRKGSDSRGSARGTSRKGQRAAGSTRGRSEGNGGRSARSSSARSSSAGSRSSSSAGSRSADRKGSSSRGSSGSRSVSRGTSGTSSRSSSRGRSAERGSRGNGKGRAGGGSARQKSGRSQARGTSARAGRASADDCEC